MDDTGRVEYWELDPEKIKDVCVCGHNVSRHTLVGTEYARCESVPGMCYCSGGVRVAGAVVETLERPSGTTTNSRFFRRQWYVGGESPLVGAIRKASESGVDFVWKIGLCDLCGQENNPQHVGYITLEGRGVFSSTARSPQDVPVVFCDFCQVEVELEQEHKSNKLAHSE